MIASKNIILITVVFLIALGIAFAFAYFYFRRPKKLDYHGFAQSLYVEIDDFKVHYVQGGRGPNLLLIHGIGSSVFCWRRIYSELTQHFSVTAIDLPGFGLSSKLLNKKYTIDDQAQRIKLFLDKLSITKTNVIAHSMGGAITAWFTHIYPDYIDKILFISPALSHKIVKANVPSLILLANLTKNIIVTPTLVKWIYYNRALAIRPPDAEEAAKQYYLPFHKSHETLIVFLKHIDLLKDKTLKLALSSFKKPSIILYGAKDKVISEKHIRKFLKNNDAQFIIEPNCGHQLMEENPTFIIDNCKKFFDI